MGAYEFNNSSVSINSFSLNDLTISIYPNPATNLINVSYEILSIEDVVVEITNNIGQVVYSKSMKENNLGRNTLKIETSEFAAGMYQLNFKTGKKDYVQKVAVVK